MAERSSGGSPQETGSGTAPKAHAANTLSTSPIELGRQMATVESSATPRPANNAARRTTRSTNPARVNVTSPHVSADRPGSASASRPRTEKKAVPSTSTEPTPGLRNRPGHVPTDATHWIGHVYPAPARIPEPTSVPVFTASRRGHPSGER